MTRRNKTVNPNAVTQNVPPRPERKGWGAPHTDEPPKITEKEQSAVRKILGTGSVPEAINILDGPASHDSTRTRKEFVRGPADTEADYARAERTRIIKDVLEELKRTHPDLGEILERRLHGEILDGIAANSGVTRERIRQKEQKVHRRLHCDARIRTLAQDLGIKITEDPSVEYLQLFGFSNSFIEMWERFGFPTFVKLKTVAILVAEILYPQCLKPPEKCEPGKDRLDKKKFASMAAKIRFSMINISCKTANPENLVDRVSACLAKYLPTEQNGKNETQQTSPAGNVSDENAKIL